jgi:hypothetical protein
MRFGSPILKDVVNSQQGQGRKKRCYATFVNVPVTNLAAPREDFVELCID